MRHQLYLLILVVFLVGCKTTYQTQSFQDKNIPVAPDYSSENSWAVLPTKYPKSLNKFAPEDFKSLNFQIVYDENFNEEAAPSWVSGCSKPTQLGPKRNFV